ncbi:TonB-dependent receptor [Thiocapsa sp.]|uniref:TonB-dependent receptor n=1 Tax=Thiocapsa sp. TaxID=2024551 RepID=UPI002600E125|nr:TonB-dependent receptor [Thiocapsa sp.]
MALLTPMTAFPATDAEIAELRAMVDQMKSQYERRIQDLESRLAKAEREADRAATRSEAAAERAEQAARVASTESRPMTAPLVTAPASAEPGATGLGALGSGNAFNPQISVFLDGNYYHDGIDGEGAALVGLAYQPSGGADQGHDHDDEEHGGHMHGLTENGFNFREAEIAFSATVDPYFDASLFLAIDRDGTVELEEGYFQTRSLPAGLRVKGGKFLSDFGYINRQHPHQWDFVDQNLPYLNLLGPHGLQDTGLQLTWLPKLPFYTLLGVEGLQGNQEIFGATLGDDDQAALELGATDDGPRLWTAFAKVAPEIGINHALQLGLSYANNNQHQEVQEHTHAHGDDDAHDEDHAIEIHRNGLAGDAQLWGVDLVYKYDGGGAHGHKNFKFQSEYLRSIKDMKITASAHPEIIGSRRTFTTDGLYAQAVYGFAPKWTAGLRYDVLGMTNEISGGGKDAGFGSSDRWTFDVTWNLSEFSRLRAQYAHNDILQAPGERERFDAFYLQFLVSMGSHGAHAF